MQLKNKMVFFVSYCYPAHEKCEKYFCHTFFDESTNPCRCHDCPEQSLDVMDIRFISFS